MEDIVILGSGPAGCTAAIYAARAGYPPVILAGPLPGGLLTQTPKIENYPGYPEAISGYDLTDAMLRQAEKFGAKVRFLNAVALELACAIKKLRLSDGSLLEARAVILALGARHKPLERKINSRLPQHGVSQCATCDGNFYRNEVVAIAGNGSIALNEALFLATMASEVHLLVPSAELAGPQLLKERLLGDPKILVHTQTRLLGATAGDDAKLQSVTVLNTSDQREEILPCRGLFLALGVTPDTELLEGTGIALDPDGYIKLITPERSLTSLPGVFAAGDCTDPRYKQAVIAAGSGAKAALDAAEYLRELHGTIPNNP